MLTILLILLLTQPPTATWNGPGRATVTWQQTTRACLSVEHATGEQAFVGCWDGPGRVTVTLGHVGSLDAAYRPTAGDVYLVQIDGRPARAPLLYRRWVAIVQSP